MSKLHRRYLRWVNWRIRYKRWFWLRGGMRCPFQKLSPEERTRVGAWIGKEPGWRPATWSHYPR